MQNKVIPVAPKWIAVLLKRLILIASWSYIVYMLLFDEQFSFKQIRFAPSSMQAAALFITVGFLTFINWLFESMKWQTSLLNTQKISLHRAFIGVLGGLSVAIITPNRSGEYFGRLFVLQPEARIKAFGITIIANLSQFVTTLFFGIIALLLWQRGFSLPFSLSFTNVSIIIVTLVAAISAILYLHRKKIKQTPFYINVKNIFQVLSSWNFGIISKILLFAVCRYIVFILQFWLLLKLFLAPISFFEVYQGIGVMYLVMALLPVITLAEPAVRCGLSVVLLGVFSPNESGIMAASLVLWCLNLALPALLGTLWLNFYKQKI